MRLLTLLFLLFTACMLTHSALSLSYAALGLKLWFQNMIPSLLPFMILSGVMVRMKLTDRAAMLLYPLVKPAYKVRKNVCFAMLCGFLCGFPMGAKVTNDLYLRQMITRREAQYLLAFCNNIGPVYFCSFVLPLLGRNLILPYLFGMYGIPLLYGLLLRHTAYRDLPQPDESKKGASQKLPELVCCETSPKPAALWERLLEETDGSIQSSIQSILSLGGYMILFNLLNLVPHMLFGQTFPLLAPLFEITGGLKLLKTTLPLYSLLALSFGGLCCLAQTYGCIRPSGLSVSSYVIHKAILTLATGAYYLCWYLMWPGSFLK